MTTVNRPIAVFDSGVGGFTVVKDIMQLLPKETIVYVGDTARAPYGHREAEEIIQFSDEICSYLMQYNPKLIVIACNTATAHALDYLQDKYDVPIIGVIKAGAKAALQVSKNKHIGVIGTIATIKSGAYEVELHRLAPDVKVSSYACPALVPLVERGRHETDEAASIVLEQLQELKETSVDSLILGCTHYPFLRRVIQKTVGYHVELIHSGYETAKRVRELLVDLDISSEVSSTITAESHIFVCTGPIELFRNIGKKWLLSQLRGRSCEWKTIQKMTIS